MIRIIGLAVCLLALPAGAAEVGIASVDDGRPTPYDGANYHGRVSTGERFSAAVLAIAHRTLPLGSWAFVKHGRTGEFARVWDRGPCLTPWCQKHAPLRIRVRVADLTPRLAKRLGCDGLCKVAIWPVPLP